MGASSAVTDTRAKEAEMPSFFNPRPPLQFSGIPFKWEMQPGIPKQLHSPKGANPPRDLLPPPPPAAAASISPWKKNKKKKSSDAKFGRDPFAAALVECAKREAEPWKRLHIRRAPTDFFFGFFDLSGSCKNPVVESKVVVRRSGRSEYQMLNRH